jgi:hypothetical protein
MVLIVIFLIIFAIILVAFLISFFLFRWAHKTKHIITQTITILLMILIGLFGLFILLIFMTGSVALYLESTSPKFVFNHEFRIKGGNIQAVKGYEKHAYHQHEIYLTFKCEPQIIQQIIQRKRLKEISELDFRANMVINNPNYWEPFRLSQPSNFYSLSSGRYSTVTAIYLLSYDSISHLAFYNMHEVFGQ